MFAWQGLHLIEDGIPVAWSTLPYPDRAEIYRGKIDYFGSNPEVSVRLYKPWLDQPPLWGLISGGFAHLYKADKSQIVPNSFIRTPAVIFATFTAILVFLIARSVSGYWSGIIAMFLYGTIPIFVFSSRLSVPENFIAFIFTLIVWFVLGYINNPKFRYLAIIPVLAGLAGLSKATGYFVILFPMYFAIKQGKWKHVFYLFLATLPFVALFFWYGNHFDAEIFRLIIETQASRPVGFASIAWFFVSPAFDIFTMTDSWYIFCLLASAYFLFGPRLDRKYIISFAFIFWLMVVAVSGGEGDLLPWYRYPAFPFMAICGAWALQFAVKKANILVSFLTIGMLLGSRSLLVNAFRSNVYPMELRLFLTALLSPAIMNSIFKNKFWLWLNRLVIIGVIVVGSYFNIVYIYNRFELVCESKNCPITPSTKLSSVYLPVIWRYFVLGPAFRHD